MKTKSLLTLALILTLGILNADAQTINKRSRHERTRIAQGVRSGELTRGESIRLAKEQRNIRRDVKKARRNDGKVGPRERQHIRREQRKASRHIYRARHNNRDRK